ncbi:MAG: thiol reductant exporter subunit CydC [Actinomycetota bacterium]
MMLLAYLLGTFAFVGGIGLTVSSGWLITMASSHPPILTLGVAIVLVRFFGIFRSVARYFERIISHRAVFDRLTSLRVDIYTNLVRKSISASSVINSGNAVKSLVDDVERAQEYQLRIKLPGVSAALALLFGVLLGWWIRAESLLITVPASIALLFILPTAISRATVKAAKRIEEEENKYTKVVDAATHGVIEARIYGYLEQTFSPLGKRELEIRKQESALIKKTAIFSGITNLVVASAIVGSSYLAYWISRSSDIPAVQIAMLIFLPLVMFEAITMWYPNLFGSGKLIASQEAVDAMLEVEEHTSATVIFNDEVQFIECKDVEVSWGSEFMTPISCVVRSGETLAVRGTSGAGKSTFAMGLLGLLPYKGSIVINGVELSTISNLSQTTAGTVQRSHIFNTSVRENLRIGNPAATDQEIMEVLSALSLDSLIREMPEGLDTILGEFGRILSGGESKRLAIARVLLARAQIVVLDEPTEHLNKELSENVTQAISQYCEGKILIVITHSDWKSADKTLVMQR